MRPSNETEPLDDIHERASRGHRIARPATAEITATPAAPASSTNAAFEAAIPPIPTTGMVVALTTSASPSGPSGTASGFVAVAQTVTPR